MSVSMIDEGKTAEKIEIIHRFLANGKKITKKALWKRDNRRKMVFENPYGKVYMLASTLYNP